MKWSYYILFEMSAPAFGDDNVEEEPLKKEEEPDVENEKEVEEAQKMLMKYRSDYLPDVDRETLSDQYDLYVRFVFK